MNTLLVETKNATSTREKIISILAADWPLTGKEIYNKLSKENGFTATYQAVHKTIIAKCALNSLIYLQAESLSEIINQKASELCDIAHGRWNSNSLTLI